MKSLIVFCVLLLFPFLKINAQNEIQSDEMSFWSTIENDSILIKIKAPTKGWLAVGFNDKNEIVGSDLKMFRVKNNRLEAEDQFVKGFQNHPSDSEVGGIQNIKLLSGEETSEATNLVFKIPLNSNDPFDYLHQPGESFWLILAYSVSDDFDHHSIMRKHSQITWSRE